MENRNYLTCISIDWKTIIVVQHSGHPIGTKFWLIGLFSGCFSISLFVYKCVTSLL